MVKDNFHIEDRIKVITNNKYDIAGEELLVNMKGKIITTSRFSESKLLINDIFIIEFEKNIPEELKKNGDYNSVLNTYNLYRDQIKKAPVSVNVQKLIKKYL